MLASDLNELIISKLIDKFSEIETNWTGLMAMVNPRWATIIIIFSWCIIDRLKCNQEYFENSCLYKRPVCWGYVGRFYESLSCVKWNDIINVKHRFSSDTSEPLKAETTICWLLKVYENVLTNKNVQDAHKKVLY